MNRLSKISTRIKKSADAKSLLANFSYLIILQIVGYIFPLITIPYLSRVIGVDGYGKIAFAVAIITWFQAIADWGFMLTATRDVAKYRNDKGKVSVIFSETFFARCFLLVISFFILVICIIFIPLFNENYKMLFITFLLIPGHIMFPEWFFQGLERMRYITIINLIIKVFFTVAIFFVIKNKEDYIYQPLLTSLGYLVAGLISMYIILYKWKYSIHFVSFKRILEILKASADVFVNNIFPNLYNSLSIVILGFFGGAAANGIYSEGNKFPNIAQMFLNIIYRVFYPLLSRRIDKHNFYASLHIGLAIIISLILYVIAPLIVDHLYTEEFLDAIPVMRIMSISIVFLTLDQVYGVNYLIVQGYEKILRKITIICSLLGLLIAFPLISMYSYIGVALTVTITRLGLGLLCLIYVSKIKKRDYKDEY